MVTLALTALIEMHWAVWVIVAVAAVVGFVLGGAVTYKVIRSRVVAARSSSAAASAAGAGASEGMSTVQLHSSFLVGKGRGIEQQQPQQPYGVMVYGGGQQQ